MKISDTTAVSMPMRNLLSILVAVAAGVWAYSEITTRLTFLETSKQLMEQDLLEANTQKPIDQEQFMMLEDLYKSTEKLVERVDGMMHNQVNIERLEKDMGKAQRDVEKLKDNLRTFSNGAQH